MNKFLWILRLGLNIAFFPFLLGISVFFQLCCIFVAVALWAATGSSGTDNLWSPIRLPFIVLVAAYKGETL